VGLIRRAKRFQISENPENNMQTMNIIGTLGFRQVASIIVAGGLTLAIVALHYVGWSIRRDARKFPNDAALQAAVVSMARRSHFFSGWMRVASDTVFVGAALTVLALGFGSHDVLQFARVLFFLGVAALIALTVHR
jgi:hypothetical protein